MTDLTGKKIAFAVANEGIEQVELEQPWEAVKAAGGTPVLVSMEPGKAQAFNHLDKGDAFEVDTTFAQAQVADYDGLVLPGGVANPDTLRTHEDAVRFVKDFVAAGKPVAAICHAPWTLVEAGLVDGLRLTSWPSLQTDIRNAGGRWTDEEVVEDRNGPGPIISSRRPDDLPAFCQRLVQHLKTPTSSAAGAR
jgi:protease I